MAASIAFCKFLPPIAAGRVRALTYPFRQARLDNIEVDSPAITGSKLRCLSSDFHAYPFIIHGYYDWRLIAAASAILVEGDTVIEIGANVGTETICLSDMVGADGAVIAFEPFPAHSLRLRDLKSRLNYRNIAVHTVALSDSEGEMLFVAPPDKFSGIGHLLQSSESAENILRVQCVTLDSYLPRDTSSKMLVIDAEGEEVRILRGAKEHILRHRPIIIAEAHPAHLSRAGFTVTDLYNELLGMEYDVYKFTRLSIAQIDKAPTPEINNWICMDRSDAKTAKLVANRIRFAGLCPTVPGVHPLMRSSYDKIKAPK
ncbi:MAG: FkbM family methyltransferase [Bacteroidota bacterium]